MSLRDFLSVPYLVEAETIDLGDGRWVRRASYPELPDCQAESMLITDTLQQLERRRVERIVDILRAGETPPVPRPPLTDCDPEGVMKRLGFGPEITGLLDKSGTEIAAAG